MRAATRISTLAWSMVRRWRHAARAEVAMALRVDYGQALLDLVRALEPIPHHVLVREANALRYPGWLIRFAVATHRMKRATRVGRAMSQAVVAVCGITAGPGSATSEMRITMIRNLDDALVAHPSVEPTMFLDSLGVEVAGSPMWVVRRLGGFLLCICRAVAAVGMESSAANKYVCSASSKGLGMQLQGELTEFGVTSAARAKALGSSIGAGMERKSLVLAQRLKNFKKRRSM